MSRSGHGTESMTRRLISGDNDAEMGIEALSSEKSSSSDLSKKKLSIQVENPPGDSLISTAFSDLKNPDKIQTAARALELIICKVENFSRGKQFPIKSNWYVRCFVGVQHTLGQKSRAHFETSIKPFEDLTWDEHTYIPVDNEASPIPVSFELIQSNAAQDRRFGEAIITSQELALLLKQDIGFEFTVNIPIHPGSFTSGDECDDNICELMVRLKVINDKNKNLLRYHPEVNINLQLDVEHLFETLSLKKAELPLWRMAFLGILSGAWMAIAGCFAFSVAGGIDPKEYKSFPILPRLIVGLLAPVAMHFIVFFGGEFFSGNCMFMSVGLSKGRISLRSFAYVILGSLAMNLVGCVVWTYLFGRLTLIFAQEPHLSFVRGLAESKAAMDPWVALARAVPANVMICLAIHMGITARDMLGKLAALHFPLTVYTVAGFEHSIGNLVAVPLGWMYGADVGLAAAFWNNLLPALVGNFLGGAAVGVSEALLFSWDHGHGNTNQLHNHAFDPRDLRRASAAGAGAGALRFHRASRLEGIAGPAHGLASPSRGSRPRASASGSSLTGRAAAH